MGGFGKGTCTATLALVALGTFAGCGGAPSTDPEIGGLAAFDATLKLAADRETVAVIDFYTDWCKYCKKFDEAKESDADLRSRLANVAFHQVNAELGDGEELAERYGVSGYPTFVVLNARGEVVNRWAGYEDPPEFIGKLDASVADPTTLEEKLARFEVEPTAELAGTLGRIHDSGGKSFEAIDFFREAQELDPASADDYAFDLFYATYSVSREDETFPFADLRETADAVVASSSVGLLEKLMTARIMSSKAIEKEDTDLLASYIRPVLAESEGADDPDVVKSRKRLQVTEALHLLKDADLAVELKRQSLPEGWENVASDLNNFAWWCFENRVNLEEAERLARKGVELAESNQEKAQILDTAAELCHLRGNCDEALALIVAALEADPEGEHYKEQKTRFEEECAG